MADPGKDKKRTKIKIEHGKLIFGPQQKQQQNITSYPSLLLLQTRPDKKEMQIKHTHKQKHKLTGCAEEWPIPVKTRKEQK
jgi:hypothetical protein